VAGFLADILDNFLTDTDTLFSRSEFDEDGPIELKEVEEVFVRVAPIWAVQVAGQSIRTTAEHPFYVVGRGWIPTRDLSIRDLLMTRCGLIVPVEEVVDPGSVETVYNWRIAEYHTYFVSGTDPGASVWAHNVYCGSKQESAQKQAKVAEMLEQIGYAPKKAARIAKHYAGSDKEGVPLPGDSLHDNLKAYLDSGGTAYTYPGGYTRLKEKALTGAKPRLPKDGVWTGEPGHSYFIPDNPSALGLKPGEVVPFRNGRPMFTKWRKGDRYTANQKLEGDGPVDKATFERTLRDLFNSQGKKPHGQEWTRESVRNWLRDQGLTPHHSGGNTFELIPTGLHEGIRHTGGAADIRFGE
jgi:hypothetical protein